MLNKNLGASHLDVLLFAIIDVILCVLDENGLEKVDCKSTAAYSLVKVVYMLIAVADLEMVEDQLCCSDGSAIIESMLICGNGLVIVEFLLFKCCCVVGR